MTRHGLLAVAVLGLATRAGAQLTVTYVANEGFLLELPPRPSRAARRRRIGGRA